MNLKKTSVITLFALLSYDSFAASSIVRAGVTPLAQSGAKVTTPTSNKSRASLGIGGYSDIGKLRPNRTQSSTSSSSGSSGSSSSGSSSGSTNNTTCEGLDELENELEELKESQERLEELIEDLTDVVEAKNQEIKDLEDDLADATRKIDDFTGQGYVTATELNDRANKIAEYAVEHATNAVRTEMSDYPTKSYVTNEISRARASISGDRLAALEMYATKDELADTIKNIDENIAKRGFVQQSGLENAILSANAVAINDAVAQALSSVDRAGYATNKYVETAVSNAINSVNAARAADLKSYTKTETMLQVVQNATKSAVDTAVKNVADKGYMLSKDLKTIYDQTVTNAAQSAVNKVKELGYVTVDVMNAADQNVLSQIEQNYVTIQSVDSLSKATNRNIIQLSNLISNVETTVNNLDVSIKNGLDTETVKGIVTATLSEGKYATKTDLNKITNDFARTINLFSNEYVSQKTVNTLSSNLEELTNSFNLLEEGMGNYVTSRQIATVTDSINSLNSSVETIQNHFADYASAQDLALLKQGQNSLASRVDAIEDDQDTFAKQKNFSDLETLVKALNNNLINLSTKLSNSYATTNQLTAVIESVSAINQELGDLNTLHEKINGVASRVGNMETSYVSLNGSLSNYTKLSDYNALNKVVIGLIKELDSVNTRLEENYATNTNLSSTIKAFQKWVQENFVTYLVLEDKLKQFDNYTTTADLGATITRLGLFAPASTTATALSNLASQLAELKGTSNSDTSYVTQESLLATLGEITYGNTGNPLFKPNPYGQLVLRDDYFASAIKDLKNISKQPLFVQTQTLENGYTKTTDLRDTITKLTDKNFDPLFVTTENLANKLGNYATSTQVGNLKNSIDGMQSSIVNQLRTDEEFTGNIADVILGELEELNDIAELKELPVRVKDIELNYVTQAALEGYEYVTQEGIGTIESLVNNASTIAYAARDKAETAYSFATNAVAQTTKIDNLSDTVQGLAKDVTNAQNSAAAAGTQAATAYATAISAQQTAATAVQSGQIATGLATELQKTSGMCSTDAAIISTALSGCK